MFARKTFCVVTGASRGLCRAIAQEIAPKLAPGSVLVTMARTGNALDELKQKLETSYPKVRNHVTVADLGTNNQGWFETVFQKMLQETGSRVSDFDQALLINNAAHPGDLSQPATNYLDKNWIDYYVSVNFVSMVLLTTHFLKLFSSQNVSHRYVVNISSGAAVVPFPSASIYGAYYIKRFGSQARQVTRSSADNIKIGAGDLEASNFLNISRSKSRYLQDGVNTNFESKQIEIIRQRKAARMMFYKNLAIEEPGVNVLNYDPGGMDTDMQREVRTSLYIPELRQLASDYHKDGKLIAPSLVAADLLSVLDENKYQPGEHIAFNSASQTGKTIFGRNFSN